MGKRRKEMGLLWANGKQWPLKEYLRGKGSEKECSEREKKMRKYQFEEEKCGSMDSTWVQEEFDSQGPPKLH